MKEECGKKQLLLYAWQTRTEAYAAAVDELAMKIGLISPEKDDRLKRGLARAQRDRTYAKNSFELHVAEHGC